MACTFQSSNMPEDLAFSHRKRALCTLVGISHPKGQDQESSCPSNRYS